MTRKAENSEVATPVTVTPELYEMSLSELIGFILREGIGHWPRKVAGRRAWDQRNSAGTRPSVSTLQRLRDSPKSISVKKRRGHLRNLLELIEAVEPNPNEWSMLINSVANRDAEGFSGPINKRYDLSEFSQKFMDRRYGNPLLIGPLYLDIAVGRVRETRLQRDVSFRNLDRPEAKLGGSISYFGQDFAQRSGGVKSNVISIDVTRDAEVEPDFLSEAFEKRLSAAQTSEGWIENGLFRQVSDCPVSVQIVKYNDRTRIRDVNAFAYTDPTRRLHERLTSADLKKIQSWGEPRFIYTAVPSRSNLELLRRKFACPIICAHGYYSPGKSFSGDRERARDAYESGNADLVIGSFYEFARAWGIPVDEARKWDRGHRMQVLSQCFEMIGDNIVMVSRCFNYDERGYRPRLNLFVYANGILRDLTDAVENRFHSQSSDFFLNARRFDSALVSNLTREGTLQPDSFSHVEQTIVLSADPLFST